LGLVSVERLHADGCARPGEQIPGNLQGFSARQKAASFTIDQAMQKMEAGFAGGSAKMPKAA